MYGEGAGDVEPRAVSFGGVSTGTVDEITWWTWGGEEAVGEGVGYYSADGESASAHASRAVVVASDLRRCDGVEVYNTIAWFFPDVG